LACNQQDQDQHDAVSPTKLIAAELTTSDASPKSRALQQPELIKAEPIISDSSPDSNPLQPPKLSAAKATIIGSSPTDAGITVAMDVKQVR
jgi:hypothetical protein